MIVYQTAGLNPGNPADLDDETKAKVLACLVRAALQLHEGRAVVSSTDWSQCDVLEQQALAAAGRIIDVRQSVRIGKAAAGRWLEVQAEIDGGKEHDEQLLVDTVLMVKDMLGERHNATG